MKQKLFMFLALLVVGVTGVWAEVTGSGTETDPYLVGTAADLQTAIDNGGFIKISANIDCGSATKSVGSRTFTVGVDKNVTIDGQGQYSITNTNPSSSARALFGVYGTDGKIDVAFKNISLESSAERIIETRGNIGTLTLNGVTMTTKYSSGNPTGLQIGGNQSDNAIVNITGKSSINVGNSGYAVLTYNPTTMTIDDSSLFGFAALYFKGESGSAGSKGSVITVKNDANLSSYNPTDGGQNFFGTIVCEDGNITINAENSTIEATGVSTKTTNAIFTNSYLIASNRGDNTFNIKEGCKIKLGTAMKYFVIDDSSCSNAVVNLLKKSLYNFDPTSSDVYNTDVYTYSEGVSTPKPSHITCQEGMYVLKNDDETYIYTIGPAVAKITVDGTTTYYATLADAVTAATEGQTITLIDDVDLTGYAGNAFHEINFACNVTLDVNGKTVTSNNGGVAYQGENVTIKNGNFVAANGGSYAMFLGDGDATNITLDDLTLTGGVNNYDATVEINNCTISGTKYYAVWAEGSSDVTINSGKFTSVSSEVGHPVVLLTSSDATILVEGGIYSESPEKYVAEGKCVMDNGDEDTKTTYPYTIGVKQQTQKTSDYTIDGVDNSEASEAAKTAVETNTLVNNNVTNFATDVKACVSSATQETIGDKKNYVSVKLTSAVTSTTEFTTGGTTIVKKMTFDVKPVYVVIDALGNESEEEIPNDVIEKGITFRLPVDKNVTAKFAKCYHINDYLGIMSISGDATSGKYIELTSSQFSEFSYTLEGQENVRGTVYAGTSTATADQTLAQFATTRESYPNAVMVVDEEYAELVQDQTNVIVKYSAGKKGNYYECPNFVLTDRATDKTVDFYAPANFTAVSGSYSRNFTATISSCTLPFALTSNEVGADIMTFAYYEPIYEEGEKTDYAHAFFRKQSAVDAATPVFIKGAANFTKTFSNTPIVVTPDNSNMAGTFAATTEFQEDGYWALNSSSDKLVPATTGTLGAFRSLVNMTQDMSFSDHSSDARASVIYIAVIGEDGTATGIDGLTIENAVPATETDTIYSISGARVNNTARGGIYIVNGKKVIK